MPRWFRRDDRVFSSPARVLEVIRDVESGAIAPETVSDGFPDDVQGLSGRRFRTLVAALVGAMEVDAAYLEIGTYHGKTLGTTAALNPAVRHVGVDDFSQVNEGGRNRQVLDGLLRDAELHNVEFVEADFGPWLADRTHRGVRDAGVYYFDASHDYRSQLLALLHGAAQLRPGGVLLVDDTNYSHVRAASYDLCDADPTIKLVYERYTEGHPMHVDEATRAEMEAGWWDGVHVLVHDPDDELEGLPRQPEPHLKQFFLGQHRIENCRTDEVESRTARLRNAG